MYVDEYPTLPLLCSGDEVPVEIISSPESLCQEDMLDRDPEQRILQDFPLGLAALFLPSVSFPFLLSSPLANIYCFLWIVVARGKV